MELFDKCLVCGKPIKEIIEKLVSNHTLNLGKCKTLEDFAKTENDFTNKLKEQLRIGGVTNSFAVVRWTENKYEDIVCINKDVAKEYIRKYNELDGKETLYLDEEIYLPVTKA